MPTPASSTSHPASKPPSNAAPSSQTPAPPAPLPPLPRDLDVLAESDPEWAANLRALRRHWKWANFSQFFYTFAQLLQMPDVSITVRAFFRAFLRDFLCAPPPGWPGPSGDG